MLKIHVQSCLYLTSFEIVASSVSTLLARMRPLPRADQLGGLCRNVVQAVSPSQPQA